MTQRLRIGGSGPPTLPLDAVTRTFGVLGQRGTGKTTAAVVLVEEIVRAGGHCAVLDPVGAWWGVTRAGRQQGLRGIVLGGEHGDVPLEETGGHLVAELVVARHWPVVVIDLKLLRKGAQLRFMADYLETLFQLNREPLHQVFEEADRALPQQGRSTGRDDLPAARTLGAGEDIVKLGRSRGLGATLVSQRPATVNKNVLEQVETLLVFRLMGPNDQKAVKAWIEANGDPAETARFMGALGKLPRGEAWLYSPAFVEFLGRIKMRNRHTFDSSFTPEVGQKVAEPTKRAPVDLDELRSRMADTVERAKANDPRELRKQIADLKRELAERPEAEPERVEVEVRVPVFPEELARAIVALNGAASDVGASLRDNADRLERAAQAVVDLVPSTRETLKMPVSRLRKPTAAPASGRRGAAPPPPARLPAPRQPVPLAGRTVQLPSNGSGEPLKAGARRMLHTLVRISPLRVSKAQLATLVGMKVTGGTFNTYYSRLKRDRLMEEGHDRLLAPTDAGFAYLGEDRPAPLTQQEVIETWRSSLKAGARRMLDVLLEQDGQPVSREELALALEMEVSGGTFNTYLSTLRRNGLAEVEAGEVRSGEALYLTEGSVR